MSRRNPKNGYFNGTISAKIDTNKIQSFRYHTQLCFINLSLLVLQYCSPYALHFTAYESKFRTCECGKLFGCTGELLNSDAEVGKMHVFTKIQHSSEFSKAQCTKHQGSSCFLGGADC